MKNNIQINRASQHHFSTNDIATMLSVTRVTVRNWIIKGRITATTTPGGHRRVSREDLRRFLEKNNYGNEIIRDFELTFQKKFIYCWQYHQHGLVNLPGQNRCGACVVFKSRAQRCYELKKMPNHKKLFCQSACEDCGYYQKYFAR